MSKRHLKLSIQKIIKKDLFCLLNYVHVVLCEYVYMTVCEYVYMSVCEYVYEPVHRYVYMIIYAFTGQGRASEFLEWELQVVVSLLK